MAIKLDDSQQAAVNKAISNKLTIIDAPAGYGKTELIKFIHTEKSGCRLCAFTNKAVQRIREASGCAAETIHRLLGFDGDKFTVTSLKGQTIIIDEASMVSTRLMYWIMAAEPDGIVLIGDHVQLPPVEPGQPYHDMVSLLPDSVATLSTCHRASGAVYDSCMEVRQGKLPEASATHGGERWAMQDVSDPETIHNRIIGAVRSGKLDPMQDIILCPKNGDENTLCSVNGLNHDIVKIVNPHGRPKTGFHVGDRVMCTENYPEKELWNGSTGTVTGIQSGVLYMDIDGGGSAMLDSSEQRKLTWAYALTTHRAQGSQYRHIIFCAPYRDRFMLDRSMIYTAVTRARKACTILGCRSTLEIGVGRETNRMTALQEESKCLDL